MENNEYMNTVVNAEQIFNSNYASNKLPNDVLESCPSEMKRALKPLIDGDLGELVFLFLHLHGRVEELEKQLNGDKRND